MRTPSRASLKKPAITLGLLVILVGAMAANTKFLNPTQASGYNPKAFSAADYAAAAFPKISATITGKAIDLTVLAPAAEKDVTSTGAQYGIDLGAGSFAFSVKTTGTVTHVDSDFMTVKVPGMPTQDVVYVPLGLALSGNPIRDAPGTIKFGDFADQTDYQSVANAFMLIIKASIIKKLNAPALVGKKISIVGAWTSGGQANTYIIQPVSIVAVP
jgi:predicted lipoprotein